jgi:hypothetical protein
MSNGTQERKSDCKQAAIEALHDLAGEHPWTYLYTQGRVATQPSFTDGTITYQAAPIPPAYPGGPASPPRVLP